MYLEGFSPVLPPRYVLENVLEGGLPRDAPKVRFPTCVWPLKSIEKALKRPLKSFEKV
jgi:hypothetical protein